MLIAIDGTSSSEWRKPDGSNSFVYKFRSDYDAPLDAKCFRDGPDVLGKAVPLIIEAAEAWAWMRYTHGDRLVDMVGHSRGGMIVIALCKQMLQWRIGPVAVRFLGLYDAVHLAPTLETTARVPDNVEYCAHAKRYIENFNRFYFRNTGRSGRAGHFFEERFFASHGAMGGASAGGLIRDDAYDYLERPRVDRWMRSHAKAAGVRFRAPV